MKKEKILVVFDGTSSYIIPFGDFDHKEHQILGSFTDIDEADIFCELRNNENKN